MKLSSTHRIILSGLFVSIGLILPYFTAHAFGLSGTILLPMHIPVLLCGLICGSMYGATVGLVTPVLSSMLTGMPPIFPMLPIMAAQLIVLGLLTGLLYHKLRLNIYLSLVISIVAGWVTYGLVLATLLLAGSEAAQNLSVISAIITGIPGLIVQLTVIPALVMVINRYAFKNTSYAMENDKQEKVVKQAKAMVKSKDSTCVVIQNQKIVYAGNGRGVALLLGLLDNQPEILKNACVVDKVIGKAAAMILVLGGAKHVYGELMSVAGREYLQQNGVEAQYGRCIEVLSNRERNGMCPLERSVLNTENPLEGVKNIRETVNAIKQHVG